jgi:hypothetical protein
MSREYRNLLADFSFTLTGAGSIRIFLKKKTPEGETPPRRHDERRPFKARRGVSVSSGLNGAVERSPVKQYAYSLSRDFYAKFQYAWPGSSDTKYFGFQARPL